jgi:hypothetical protein
MAETNKANISVGYALYTEFRKDGHTLQVIYTPESMSVDKNDNTTPIYVPSTIWRRQVSSYSPRRPWRAYSQEWKVVNERRETRTANGGSAETLDHDLAKKYAVGGLVFMDRTFHSLVDQKWELYKEPVVIEFSQEDLEDTRDWNTPNALIRRIMRSRKALGFPDELFDLTPTPAV